jgi:hypothetical protein
MLHADAEPAVAITANNRLLNFDTEAPENITIDVPITGLAAGDFFLGIDFRPADRSLYGLANGGALYRINVATGAATRVTVLSPDPSDSSAPFTGLSGNSFGIDFNPVVDRLRVVSDTEQNLRINPTTGGVITDNPLNPGDPSVTGAAYSNNFAGATTTTLYVIDSQSNTLAIQNPPNNGSLSTVGPLGGDAPQIVGFDISPNSGIAYASALIVGSSTLYTIDLATGTATFSGQIGNGSQQVTDISIAQPTQLLNLSTRARVGTGEDVMIAGLITQGGAPSRLLARALGPSLAGAGVTQPLQDPVLSVFDSNGNLIATNDNWRSSQEAEIAATGLAPSNDNESALVGYLAPGSYTLEVSGKNNTSGVALVEVYQLQ